MSDLNFEQNKTTSNQPESLSIIEKIFSLLTGLSSDERIKAKKLKEIDKKLKGLKYKFYNFKKEQILPQFGAYLYEMYRGSQHLSKFFDSKAHAKSIKTFLFDIFSSESQNKLRDEINTEIISKRLKNAGNLKEEINKVQKSLNQYIKSFDGAMIKNINSTYNDIVNLSNIINFDWYSLLHKFDSEIKEAEFNYKPEYETIEGKYVLDELVSLSDYLETIDFKNDWKNIGLYLKKSSDDPEIEKIFKKIMQQCKILKQHDYILMIVRLIYKDPFFNPKTFPSRATIVQDYILTFQAEIQTVINKIIAELKKDKINNLLMEIFHTTAIVRMKYYNETLNDTLLKKNVSGVKFIDPLNYLKAFLLDFCKGEIKPRIDLLLIKGTWNTHSASSELSTILEGYNKLSERVIKFDNSCSEEESNGRNLKKLIFAVAHDPNARTSLKKLLFKLDSEASQIVTDGIALLTTSALKIKSLIEDYKTENPNIILNIRKIQWEFTDELPTDLGEIYKKISHFVALLKYFVKTPAAQPKQVEKKEE